jgi:hypothetical protein
MTGLDEYSVFQFFPDETYERVAAFTGAKLAVETAAALTRSVGAKLGTTRRVIITDGGDFTVFEWKFGQGVTFPPPLGGLHVR